MNVKVQKVERGNDSSSVRVSTAKGERVRDGILNAALLMIERHGFAKLTLDDIAGHMGKCKGFLYYYYPDKASILVAMLEREGDRIRRGLTESVASVRTGLEKLEAYLFAAFSAIEQRMDLIAALNRDVQDNEHAMLMTVVKEMRDLDVIDGVLMESFLQEGARDGSLRAMSGEEIEAVAGVLRLGLNGIAYAYMVGQSEMPPRRCFEVGCATLLQGLRPNGMGELVGVSARKSDASRRVKSTLEELDRGALR